MDGDLSEVAITNSSNMALTLLNRYDKLMFRYVIFIF